MYTARKVVSGLAAKIASIIIPPLKTFVRQWRWESNVARLKRHGCRYFDWRELFYRFKFRFIFDGILCFAKWIPKIHDLRKNLSQKWKRYIYWTLTNINKRVSAVYLWNDEKHQQTTLTNINKHLVKRNNLVHGWRCLTRICETLTNVNKRQQTLTNISLNETISSMVEIFDAYLWDNVNKHQQTTRNIGKRLEIISFMGRDTRYPTFIPGKKRGTSWKQEQHQMAKSKLTRVYRCPVWNERFTFSPDRNPAKSTK